MPPVAHRLRSHCRAGCERLLLPVASQTGSPRTSGRHLTQRPRILQSGNHGVSQLGGVRSASDRFDPEGLFQMVSDISGRHCRLFEQPT